MDRCRATRPTNPHGETKTKTQELATPYAEALYKDASSTLDDLRESVATLEELNRTTRRVLGNAHPLTTAFENDLRNARAALRARETPSPGA